MKAMILAVAALVCAWSICGGSDAQTKAAPPDARVPRQATGHGETEANAKEEAMRQAVKQVARWMSEHNPPLESFVLTEGFEDFVRTHVVKGTGKAGDDVPVEIADKKQVFKEWILPFRTDNSWWSDLERLDREAERKVRAADRETVAFRGVLGLSVLLLAGFGYVRLDQYTRYRYTTWLRLAGAGVLAVALAGLWWAIGG